MTLYEYWNIADPAMTWAHGAFWQGQTFTPQKTHIIKSVKLLMYRHGSPGDGTISIKATVDGHPNGADLCSAIFYGNDLVDKYIGQWVEVTLDPANIELTEDVKYAIVARLAGGDQDNYVRWLSSTAKPYTRGAHEFSSDSGASWDTNEARDMKFKEYGEAV